MGWFNYSHLPNWLEGNPIFRSVFLFRKLFLTKRKQYYYGQEAEDVALKRLFQKDYKGFFVDVGCFHPVKYNNTYYFYKKGWRGVNIDIDTIKIQGFNWVRRGDKNIAKAVSDHKGEIEYWSNGFYSLVNTLEKEVANTRDNYRLKIVECDTLTNILDLTKYKNKQIDLLSIDAEGHDFKVLESLDFKKYNPKIIVVETYAKHIEEVVDLVIYKYLKDNDYELVNWMGLSLIFKHKNYSKH